MAHPKHQSVRQRYQYRCGYCGVSEVNAGGELTVDHYLPVSAGGDDSDDNLVYACSRCNLYKSDIYGGCKPISKRASYPASASGRPDAAPARANEQTGMMEGLTATGDFHIGILQLNRPALVEQRQRKRRYTLLVQQLQVTQAELAKSQSESAAQGAYIRLIEMAHGIFRRNMR